jgi:hypothetical protein
MVFYFEGIICYTSVKVLTYNRFHDWITSSSEVPYLKCGNFSSVVVKKFQTILKASRCYSSLEGFTSRLAEHFG